MLYAFASALFAFDILLFLGRLFMHAPSGKKIRCVCVCRILFYYFQFHSHPLM